MGNQSSQCNYGTFGTGKGIPVNYNGTQEYLGGKGMCNATLGGCAEACQAMGCGKSGEQWADCCKMCERSCCQPGPAYDPDSRLCKQISDKSNRLPNDYCTNKDSRNRYDEECPEGCQNLPFSQRMPQSKQTMTVKDCKTTDLRIIFLLSLLVILLFYLRRK